MARRSKKLFSSGSGRKRRDYRNAGIGPDMGGFDAKGNKRRGATVRKTPSHAAPNRGQVPRQVYRPGEIGYVRPQTASGESVSDHAKRQQRKVRTMRPQSDTGRRVGLIVAVVVIALLIAGGVATCVFHNSVNSRMSIDDSTLSEALVGPTDANAAYYVLIAGNTYDPSRLISRPEVSSNDDPDILMLVRVDAASKAATIISVPSNLVCTLSDGSSGYISHEVSLGGNAALVSRVAEFAGVDISHFITIDADGISALVDAVGGINLTLDEEVDDPDAGTIYLPAGEQTLNGAQALVLVRANNFAESYQKQAENQMAEVAALVAKLASDESFGSKQSAVDAIAGCFKTDFSSGELISLLESFSGISASDIKQARVPGSTNEQGDTVEFDSSSTSWTSMMETVNAGGDPNEKSDAVKSVDPSKYTVTVLNGAGTDGVANDVASALETAGYKVKDTGNTEQFAYNETLIVYNSADDEPAAEAVAEALGVGRAVDAGIYYSFDTDLEVIVGQDWMPAS